MCSTTAWLKFILILRNIFSSHRIQHNPFWSYLPPDSLPYLFQDSSATLSHDSVCYLCFYIVHGVQFVPPIFSQMGDHLLEPQRKLTLHPQSALSCPYFLSSGWDFMTNCPLHAWILSVLSLLRFCVHCNNCYEWSNDFVLKKNKFLEFVTFLSVLSILSRNKEAAPSTPSSWAKNITSESYTSTQTQHIPLEYCQPFDLKNTSY